MNVYVLKDKVSGNYYIKPKRWGPKMEKAKIFVGSIGLGEARETRASQKNKIGDVPIKISIVEFELVERVEL